MMLTEDLLDTGTSPRRTWLDDKRDGLIGIKNISTLRGQDQGLLAFGCGTLFSVKGESSTFLTISLRSNLLDPTIICVLALPAVVT